MIVSPATLIVAWRASPALGATFNLIVPLPLPFEPAVIAIQPALLAAVHAHAGELAVTVTKIVPPLAATGPSGPAMVNRHGADSCVTSTAVSFTVTVPCRGDGSALAATRYARVPSPCPAADDVIEIHEVAVDADHVQSRLVLTVIVPAAPAAGTEVIELLTVT